MQNPTVAPISWVWTRLPHGFSMWVWHWDGTSLGPCDVHHGPLCGTPRGCAVQIGQVVRAKP